MPSAERDDLRLQEPQLCSVTSCYTAFPYRSFIAMFASLVSLSLATSFFAGVGAIDLDVNSQGMANSGGSERASLT